MGAGKYSLVCACKRVSYFEGWPFQCPQCGLKIDMTMQRDRPYIEISPDYMQKNAVADIIIDIIEEPGTPQEPPPESGLPGEG